MIGRTCIAGKWEYWGKLPGCRSSTGETIKGKLGKYSWVIDPSEWTTLYIGDTNDHNTLFDGFVNGDPEEAILNSIIKAEGKTL